MVFFFFYVLWWHRFGRLCVFALDPPLFAVFCLHPSTGFFFFFFLNTPWPVYSSWTVEKTKKKLRSDGGGVVRPAPRWPFAVVPGILISAQLVTLPRPYQPQGRRDVTLTALQAWAASRRRGSAVAVCVRANGWRASVSGSETRRGLFHPRPTVFSIYHSFQKPTAADLPYCVAVALSVSTLVVSSASRQLRTRASRKFVVIFLNDFSCHLYRCSSGCSEHSG